MQYTRPLAALLLAAALTACTEPTPPTAVPDPGVPESASSPTFMVPLRVTRFSPGSGSVLVTSGIPLPRGAMRPADSSNTWVYLGGKAQRIHVEILHSRHPDGSVRAVLVQFYAALDSGIDVTGSFRLAKPRPAKNTMPLPAESRTRPDAVALPSDPAYLASTELVGPTLTADQTAALGFSRYDQDFAQYEAYHWHLESDGAKCDNYYDRALVYYAAWVRTANPEYWRRGTQCAWNYRVNYLEPNNYGVPAYWSQLEGLEKHYLLTGDDSSRVAVGRQTRFLRYWYRFLDDSAGNQPDDRTRARTIMGMLLSWRLDAEAADLFQYQLDTALTKILRTQHADGSFTSPWLCNLELNYMAGQLNDALMKYYWWFQPDPRIVAAMQRNVDFMWNTQWVPSAQLFQYMTGYCAGEGDTTPSNDLNDLIVNGFAFMYDRTGDPKYRAQADSIFTSAMAHTWLAGSKQFTQQYTSSFLTLGLRH